MKVDIFWVSPELLLNQNYLPDAAKSQCPDDVASRHIPYRSNGNRVPA
jgi:hypothetical protein